MIKNLIFDFGDVFINLDKAVVTREVSRLKDLSDLSRIQTLNEAFETGKIGPESFLEGLGMVFPRRSSEQLTNLWNAMLLDFPDDRLDFLEDLAGTGAYRLFLLSNTNELHIHHVKEKMGERNFRRFKASFEGFYLSHELGLRKPDQEIYEYVLRENNLRPNESFFVDDTLENINAAAGLGIKTWHLQVGKEDITSLKNRL